MWEGGGVHFGIMSGLQRVQARVLEGTGGGGSVLGVSCEYVPGGCGGGGGGGLSGMPRLVDDGGAGRGEQCGRVHMRRRVLPCSDE